MEEGNTGISDSPLLKNLMKTSGDEMTFGQASALVMLEDAIATKDWTRQKIAFLTTAKGLLVLFGIVFLVAAILGLKLLFGAV